MSIEFQKKRNNISFFVNIFVLALRKIKISQKVIVWKIMIIDILKVEML